MINMANNNVSFKYGSFQNYQNLPEKDSNVLYFLENGQIYRGDELMDTMHAVKAGQTVLGTTTDSEGFPQIITDKMIRNFFISLTSGKIKYVDDDKNLIDISALFLEGILINETFIKNLKEKIADEKEIVMPTLTVRESDHTLSWSSSNVDTLTVLIPKN